MAGGPVSVETCRAALAAAIGRALSYMCATPGKEMLMDATEPRVVALLPLLAKALHAAAAVAGGGGGAGGAEVAMPCSSALHALSRVVVEKVGWILKSHCATARQGGAADDGFGRRIELDDDDWGVGTPAEAGRGGGGGGGGAGGGWCGCDALGASRLSALELRTART